MVVNADDGGLAASTDEAILRCATDGIVRAVSVVANGPTVDSFVPRARAAGLDLGLHIDLREGRPLTDCRTLPRAASKEEFWAGAAAGAYDDGEIRAEVTAQWERLLALGVTPTHVDGHNHVHLLPAVQELIADWGVWVRVPLERGVQPDYLPAVFTRWAQRLRGPAKRTDGFAGYGFCLDPTEDVFLDSLDPDARVTEFMVHPGSRPGSAFVASARRDREVEVLCSPGLRAALRDWTICGFSEVACA